MSRDSQRFRKTYSYHNVQPKITSLEIIVDETLDFKHSVRVATTSGAPVTFSGATPTIIDGITLANEDRVLLKDQASASQNGIYYYEVSSDGGSYSLVRASDARQGTLDSGAFTYVEEGNVGEKTSWVLTTKNPITIDVTDLTWELFGATGGSVASIFTTQGSKARTTYNTSFDSDNRYVDSIGSDVAFFVSGSNTHKAVFGGDIVGSGSLVVNGSVHSTSLTGSLTNIADGTSYLIAGSGITISTGSNGAVTITNNGTVGDITAVTAGTGLSGGGTSGAVTLNLSNTGSAGTYGSATQVPVFSADAQGRVASVTNTSIQIAESQVTSLTTDLGNRALTSTTITAGTGLSGGGDLSASRTLSINNTIVATVSGTTFTGITKHNSGLSGSLTKLTDGTSYLIAGGNVTVATGSNGSVTFATINSGTIHGVTAGTGLTGGGTSGTVTLNLSNTGSAGTYGSATQVPIFSTDAQGRVASVTNTSIQIAESQVNSLTTDLGNRALTSTTISAGTGLSGGGDLSASRTLSIDNSVVATISGSTFTGAVKFNAGLSGSLTQSGATAGSVFFAGTGGVLSQNNSNLFWNNTNAMLGIGTANPQVQIDISGSANSQIRLQTGGIDFRVNAEAGTLAGIIGTYSAHDLLFYTNTTSQEKMRITAAGNVGIGTISTGGEKLRIYNSSGNTVGVYSNTSNASLALSGYNSTTPVTFGADTSSTAVNIGSSTNHSVNLLTNSTAALTINTSQNVGIGTTSFTGRLYITGSSTGATPTLVVRHGVASGSDLPVLKVQNSAGASLLHVSGSGNVGIGTTNPLQKLQVGSNTPTSTATPDTISLGGTYSSTAAVNLKIRLYDDGAGAYGGIGTSLLQQDYSIPALNSHVFYISAAEVLRIDSAGNVGIGTSASSTNKLHVYKSGASAYSVIQSSNANSYLNLLGTYNSSDMSGTIGVENGMMSLGTSTNHPLVIGTSGSEQVRITSGGSVGIGTSTITAAKLHVQGSSTGTDTTLLVRHNVANGSNLPVVNVQNSAGTSLLFVSGSGKVGIGTTSPSGNLQLESGEAWFKTTADTPSYTHFNYGVAGDNYISSGNDSSILVGQTTIRGKSVGTAQTDIAYFTVSGTSPRVGIGTAAVSYYLKLGSDSAAKPSTNTWTVSSDMRLKENIETIKNPLERILQLRGVEFDWKPGLYGVDVVHDGGFIAQELEESFPHWVRESEASEEEKTYITEGLKKDFAMRNDFYALTVESFRELKSENDTLKSENEEIKKSISELRDQIIALTKIVNK